MSGECQEQDADTEDGKVEVKMGPPWGSETDGRAECAWVGMGGTGVSPALSRALCPPLQVLMPPETFRKLWGLQNCSALSHRNVLASQKHGSVFLKPLPAKNQGPFYSHNSLNLLSQNLLKCKHKFIYMIICSTCMSSMRLPTLFRKSFWCVCNYIIGAWY